MTEIDAKTGGLGRVIHGNKYRFNQPGGIAVVGGRVWVTDTLDNSVKELDARTGAQVRVLVIRRRK